tara:strand:- start:52 stop:510 length:459 start_codon:yes stop_codon:yes gene_type:complete
MQKEIQQWIDNFVTKPNKLLNGFPPCPYARTALIKYVETDHLNMLFDILENWDDDVQVVVLHTPTENYTPEGLQFVVKKFNEIAMQKDIVALEDHPDDVEDVNGVKMNFGKCIIVLVQRLSKINEASHLLKEKGYYKNWSKENLDDVVNWRE